MTPGWSIEESLMLLNSIMKKRNIFLAVVITCMFNTSYAQNNLDLELWTGIECNNWGTINSFMFFGAPQTVFQETINPGEGLSSAKLTTAYWPGATGFGAPSDTVGGYFTLGGPITGPIGIPYTTTPEAMSFMYKADLQPGDTGIVLVQLSYWSGSQVVFAEGIQLIVGSGAWQTATIPILDNSGGTITPDTLQIICASSIGSLFGSSLPMVGSTIYVDDFVMNNCTTSAANFTASTNNLSASFTDASITTGSVTYAWDFGDGTGTSSLQNPTYTYASAGTYSVCLAITDDCGTDDVCKNVVVVSCGVNITTIDETVAGANDGTAAATAYGTSPFTYQWSDPSSQTTATATGLAPGNYILNWWDADTCFGDEGIIINPGPAPCNISLATTVTDETGPGANDGTATAFVSNGTSPYSYLWSTMATTSSVSGLAPGTYTIEVLDADSCSTWTSADVQEFQCTVTGTTSSTPESAPFAMDGTATITASGGTTPYTYSWSTFATTSSISGLGSGIYDVTVSDNNGCTYETSVAVNAVGCALTASASGTNESQAGANDGSATVTLSGGTPPYVYSWSNGGTTASISSIAPGDYTIIVVAADSCLATATYTVLAGQIIGIDQVAFPILTVKVYPNPATDIVNFEIIGANHIEVQIYDFAGKYLKMFMAEKGITEFNSSDLQNGLYFYRLIDKEHKNLSSGKFLIVK